MHAANGVDAKSVVGQRLSDARRDLMEPVIMRVSAAICCLICFSAAHAYAGKNLVFNGGFDDPACPLNGWNYNYVWLGNRHYMNNHEKVSVVPIEGSKRNVLCLWKRTGISGVYDEVKVESKPIPFEFGSRYRLTLDARTTEPRARIYFIGYKWKPGIAPHPDPELWELRKIFKGKLLYFESTKTGPMSMVPKSWKTASTDFPMKDLSKLSLQHLEEVKFLTVHIIVVHGGETGKLYIDNVKVEKIE